MQQDQSKIQEQLGSQGNEGMYGQGQYDSEGKPDPQGAEAQRLKPDPTVNEKPVTQGSQRESQGNQQSQQPSQPISPKQ